MSATETSARVKPADAIAGNGKQLQEMNNITIRSIAILFLIGISVYMCGCLDVETTPPVNEPDMIEIPTVAWTPTPDARDKTDITRLSRYDRDGDGSLNKQELQVIETDYHHKRLTDSEIACFVKAVGYAPVLNPPPVAIAIPTIYDLGNTRKLPSYIPPSNRQPIPDDYYSQSCQLPTSGSMQEYLANSEWVRDYDAGGWDCSQMAAYMEFMLENCGYHTVFRRADVEGEQYGHVWILVEFRQGWFAYECTGRYWVYPSEAVARSYGPYGYVRWNPSAYDASVQYESIYDIWNSYSQYSDGETAFLKEYGWWTP